MSPTPRVLLLALGTRGDVEPFARLGQALRAHGYDVTAAVLADGASRMTAAGVRPVVVGPSSAQVMWSSSAVVRAAAHANPGLMYLQMRRALAARAPEVATALLPHLGQADAVLSGLPTARLVPLLQAAGVPSRLVLAAPLLPHPGGTSTWSGPGWDLLPAGVEGPRQHLMWRMTHGLSGALARHVARGMRPGAATRDAPAGGYAPLLGTSEVLDPRPARGVHATGWWADPSPVRPLPPELTSHLAANPGAVLLALGSMPSGTPDRRAEQLVAVADRLGRGAVVQVSGATPGRRGRAWVCGDVDHRALLPRVAAVVHHGGSGTTHAVTAAGVPQVVVPHLGDQSHYARRVHQAGLGPAPLPRSRATGAAVLARLRAAVEDPAHARAAAAAKGRMAQEEGVAAALAAVATMVA